MFHKTILFRLSSSKSSASSSSLSKSPLKLSTNIISKELIIPTITSTFSQLAGFIGGPLVIFYFFLLMNTFYQVMGAVRCPKLKKHAGIKLRPINKAKEPFSPNDMLLYSCESAEFTQSIKCLDDGRWSETPHCPDPVNFTCPDLGPIPHGYHNGSESALKVGTIVAFRCENELIPGINPSFFTTPSTTTTTTTTTSIPSSNYSTLISNNLSAAISETTSQQEPLRYNLTGHRLLKCLPSSKWNHQMPICSPIYPEPVSNVSFVLTSALLIILPILIIVTIIQLFIKWRKRQQQRARWKQYFTDYKYRHSKTSITFAMRPQSSNANPTIPVTDL